ncbi:hypothetical protein B7494_g4384 [Chlorociboria aeruginascens]|nr:hypothetical protein B7494_g4384 [Chlorociboria aeruginascens]
MPARDLRLLALDGGGFRGLSGLMILKRLMETIDRENPPKPCDYFDMIGGTSTGGLIAVMLGRLKMSIDDSIDTYLSLSDRVFQKKRHCVTVKGKIQGRFDSEELTQAMKEVVAAQKLKEDVLLKDVSDDACKVLVCATSKETSEIVCLTSYKSPRGGSDLLNSVQIWEACRATSAASTFFDPIAIGRYEEEFVDGAMGANNPVWEVWNEAQLLWGSQQLENKIKCLVSIGTGVPSSKKYRDDVLHIGETLAAIATETERTAERFRRDKSHLEDHGQYYRFNVDRGLEEIGLDESKKRKEIGAATRQYLDSQSVFRQMQACANNMAGREYFGEYRIVFGLKGVPKVSSFVERPVEMAELERALLPERQCYQQKRLVLHGLGGIGKTQLAVKFASQHHRKFSAVIWLDGRSRNSLKQSIASCASRIAEGQISEPSRMYTAGSNSDINAVVQEVMDWLAREDNDQWLLIFDNVDRDYGRHNPDPDAYDVTEYFSGAEHGSVLITTRLAKLEQLGEPLQLGKVSQDQARAILQTRYKRKYDLAEGDRLLDLFDGLPLAIAQAAAFLQETGTTPQKYIEFYNEKWKKLMVPRDCEGAPLQDYPDRCVWKTWVISFDAIRKANVAVANLLLLWAFLDSKDLWYGVFATACSKSTTIATSLSYWIRDIADDELEFTKSIQMLRNYSLVEDGTGPGSYATHPVVHTWAYYFQGDDTRRQLAQLAVLVIGWAVPHISSPNHSAVQRRLLPHAQACSRWIVMSQTEPNSAQESGSMIKSVKEQAIILRATFMLGNLYASQGNFDEAEKMYQRALQGYETAFGAKHETAFGIMNDLGNLYKDQGKLAEAEKMYQRALYGFETTLGVKGISIFQTISNLGNLYNNQDKFDEAEKMYQRALQDHEKALGSNHISILTTIHSMGNLYNNQGKLDEAEKMFQRALQGYETTLGSEHISTITTIHSMGNLYKYQGKLAEAEKMYKRALHGFETILDAKHISIFKTIHNLGNLYTDQGKLAEAEKMYQRALQGYEKALGINFETYIPALHTKWGLAFLFECQADLAKARIMYSEALDGYEKAFGPDHPRLQKLRNKLSALDAVTKEREENERT